MRRGQLHLDGSNSCPIALLRSIHPLPPLQSTCSSRSALLGSSLLCSPRPNPSSIRGLGFMKRQKAKLSHSISSVNAWYIRMQKKKNHHVCGYGHGIQSPIPLSNPPRRLLIISCRSHRSSFPCSGSSMITTTSLKSRWTLRSRCSYRLLFC